ncbi:transposase, partial [Micromonospora olivasterospora]
MCHAYTRFVDHVHLFVRADPNASPSYIANQFKGFTSRVLR